VNAAILDQRIRDAEEDVTAAKSDTDKARAIETLDDLSRSAPLSEIIFLTARQP